jgi:hypothetical protein
MDNLTHYLTFLKAKVLDLAWKGTSFNHLNQLDLMCLALILRNSIVEAKKY